MKIPDGFEEYTWMDRKCSDAFCNKSASHLGKCDDDLFPYPYWEKERTGIREKSMESLLSEAELRGRIQANESARKHFERVFEGLLALSADPGVIDGWHRDWLYQWVHSTGLGRAMMETEMIMNGVEDETEAR